MEAPAARSTPPLADAPDTASRRHNHLRIRRGDRDGVDNEFSADGHEAKDPEEGADAKTLPTKFAGPVEASRRGSLLPPPRRWKRRLSDGAALPTDTKGERRRHTDARWLPPLLRSAPRCFLSTAPFRSPTAEFRTRLSSASLSAAASLASLSSLVLSGQSSLPAVWVAHVLSVMSIKSTLGGTVLSTSAIFVPLVPVAVLSWGTSLALNLLGTAAYSAVLPFLVASVAFLVMSCPFQFLTSKNMMLVVFYIIVSTPLSIRFDGSASSTAAIASSGRAATGGAPEYGFWFAPGLVGTCAVGLASAVAIHFALLPTPMSTSAGRRFPRTNDDVRRDTRRLLAGTAALLGSIGKSTTEARVQCARIELNAEARDRSVATVEGHLLAVGVERKMAGLFFHRWRHGARNGGIAMEEWAAHLRRQQTYVNIIRLTATQRLLGEEWTARSDILRVMKTRMADHLGCAVAALASTYDDAEMALLAGLNVANHRESSSRQAVRDASSALRLALAQYRDAKKTAIYDAEDFMEGNAATGAAAAAASAPLIRARVIFHALYSLASDLADIAERFCTEEQEEDGGGKEEEAEGPIASVGKFLASRLRESLCLPWLWHDIAKRRLALKTAVGMGLASLWVAVPYLRGIAHPNGIWPGITVASVNLESTGAAYNKCIDRLWGTLVAAAYALLVARIFSPDDDAAKVPSIAVFTFAAMLVQNPKRPYASQYAATSVGSILYGSIEVSFDVEGYVPNRIMLIFVGVIMFLLVELLLFPRSSRIIVQARSLQFFEETELFLYEASKVVAGIVAHRPKGDGSDGGIPAADDPLRILRTARTEIVADTEDLAEVQIAIQKLTKAVKSELQPGINEPSIGLNIALYPSGYRRLIRKETDCGIQLGLLITSVSSLIGYYAHLEEDHFARSLGWPSLLSDVLLRLAEQLTLCCDNLRVAFPDGVCRPNEGNSSSDLVSAIACFRDFEDIRLRVLSEWAERDREYLLKFRSMGVWENPVPGFRVVLALAVSELLEIGRCLQDCGESLEMIVRKFPPDNMPEKT